MHETPNTPMQFSDGTYHKKGNGFYQKAYNIGWCYLERIVKGEIKQPFFIKENPIIDQLIPQVPFDIGAGFMERGRSRVYPFEILYKGQKYLLNDTEIRLLSKNGDEYVLPSRVIYSIDQGIYTELDTLSAILENCHPIDSPEFRAYIQNFLDGEYEPYDGIFKGYYDEADRLKNLLFSDYSIFRDECGRNPGAIDIVTKDGSFLMCAITSGREKLAVSLIEQGINLTLWDGYELAKAVYYGQINTTKALLEKDIKSNLTVLGYNPLFQAVQGYQHLHVIDPLEELLIKKGKHTRYINSAVQDNHKTIIELLLSYGYAKDLRYDKPIMGEITVKDYAINENMIELAAML